MTQMTPSVRPIVALALLAAGLVAATLSPTRAAQVQMQTSLANPVVIAERKQTTHLKVGLTGFELRAEGRRAPVNVALVIDRSGSMSGEKLEKAKEAAIMAINRLGPRDIVSVVAYDHNVQVLVPATRVGDRDDIIRRIRALSPGGNTALFAGVSKGAAEVRKFLNRDVFNRIVLLSDGLANVGPSSPGALADLGRSLGRDRISVTTIGLGSGYNEDLMVRLAQSSDGNHAFAANAEDLIAIFDREFRDVLSVVAQEVRIRVRCVGDVRPVRVLGREGEFRGQTVDVYLNQLYSKQEKYALLEIELPAHQVGEVFDVAHVEVTYTNAVTRATDRLTAEIRARASGSEREVTESIDRGAAAAAVAQVANEANIEAMKLRDAGDVAAARRVLRQNAAMLSEKSKDLRAPELRRMSEMQEEDAEAVGSSAWNTSGRKRMRERQYRVMQNQAE